MLRFGMSFEQKQDQLHQMMLRGELGCPFAVTAAERNEVLYASIGCNRTPEDVLPALQEFARDQSKRVLAAIPAANPRRFHTG